MNFEYGIQLPKNSLEEDRLLHYRMTIDKHQQNLQEKTIEYQRTIAQLTNKHKGIESFRHSQSLNSSPYLLQRKIMVLENENNEFRRRLKIGPDELLIQPKQMAEQLARKDDQILKLRKIVQNKAQTESSEYIEEHRILKEYELMKLENQKLKRLARESLSPKEDLSLEIIKQKQQIQALQKENKQLIAQIQANTQMPELRKRIIELSAQNEALSIKNQTLSNQISEIKIKENDRYVEIDKLKQKLMTTESEKQQLFKSIVANNSLNSTLPKVQAQILKQNQLSATVQTKQQANSPIRGSQLDKFIASPHRKKLVQMIGQSPVTDNIQTNPTRKSVDSQNVLNSNRIAEQSQSQKSRVSSQRIFSQHNSSRQSHNRVPQGNIAISKHQILARRRTQENGEQIIQLPQADLDEPRSFSVSEQVAPVENYTSYYHFHLKDLLKRSIDERQA